MHVPVEILRRDGQNRWFRLSTHVGPDSLRLAHVVPEELDGPLAIAFHLPGDPVAVRCSGRALEETVGEGEDEHAERRALALIDVDEAARTRIAQYVTERLGLI
ncbi:MAG TPA: hypothetical protein VGL86_23870 [Polyangia bacterium]